MTVRSGNLVMNNRDKTEAVICIGIVITIALTVLLGWVLYNGMTTKDKSNCDIIVVTQTDKII